MCHGRPDGAEYDAGLERGPPLLKRIDRVAGPADLFAECSDEEGGEQDERCGEWEVRRRMRDVHCVHQGVGDERNAGHEEQDREEPRAPERSLEFKRSSKSAEMPARPCSR